MFLGGIEIEQWHELGRQPAKWSNTLKQFVGCCRVSVSDHFVGLALQGLTCK